MLTLVLFLSLLCQFTKARDDLLVLSNMFSDNMVLQKDRPVVYGKASDSVTVSYGLSQVSATPDSTGWFHAQLPAQSYSPSHSGGQDLVVELTSNATLSITLKSVLMGEVYVCSGQSNMEFSVPASFRAEEIYQQLDLYPNLRLIQLNKRASKVPQTDVVPTQFGGWQSPNSKSICGGPGYTQDQMCVPHCGNSVSPLHKSYRRKTWGYFSALCYNFGVSLMNQLEMNNSTHPIGLIATAWGGTRIQPWSPASITSKCNALDPSQRYPPGYIFNSMIYPIQKMSISGAVWMQGESNSPHYDIYQCMLTNMIQSWRNDWNGQTKFPFVIIQLSDWTKDGIILLRQSQYNVSQTVENTGLVVSIDLADPASPCNSVHFRNKTAVGERAASIMYMLNANQHDAVNDAILIPEAITSTFNDAAELLVQYPANVFLTSIPLQKSNDYLFQVNSNDTWIGVPAVISGSSGATGSSNVLSLDLTSVNITSSVQVKGLRYGFAQVPTGRQFVFGQQKLSPVDKYYSPASPFMATCQAGSCSVVGKNVF